MPSVDISKSFKQKSKGFAISIAGWSVFRLTETVNPQTEEVQRAFRWTLPDPFQYQQQIKEGADFSRRCK